MSSKSHVAFAGLGAMGYGMCSCLLENGYPINAYDPYPPSLGRIVAKGARKTNSPKEAATDIRLFICMVANHHQANTLLFDPATGALVNMPNDATIMMCSTVAPAYITEVRKRLDESGRRNIKLIDCPVSGGAVRAANGTLSIFASGEADDVEAVTSILSCMSDERKLYNIGSLGAGSKAKLVHQIFAGIHIAMASEAMGLAAKAGLNTRKAFEELNQGQGASWMFGNRVPHMLDPSLPPYSAMTIIAKDVGIITSTSRDFKFPLPLLSVCEQLYQQAISSGMTTDDDCWLLRLYLPKEQDLVTRQTDVKVESDVSSISVEDIRSLMVGVHIAAATEAMSFCEKLGIDIDLMRNIVDNAAGSSEIFKRRFEGLWSARWSVSGLHNAGELRDKLVRMTVHFHMDLKLIEAIQSASIAKAYDLRYPLFLSSAALQEFQRQLQRE